MGDTSSGIISNRPGIISYFESHYPKNQKGGQVGSNISLEKVMNFNNYNITHSCIILEVCK